MTLAPMPHLKVIVRIDEDSFLESGLANLVVADPGEQLIAAVGLDDFEAEVFHQLDRGVPLNLASARLASFS
jgi:hypothetical protein